MGRVGLAAAGRVYGAPFNRNGADGDGEMHMTSTKAHFVAVTVLAGLTSPATPSVEAQNTALFAAVQETPPRSGPLTDRTIRSRLVSINLAELQHARAVAASRQAGRPAGTSVRTDRRSLVPGLGVALTLNLFEDTVVRGTVEWTEPTFSGGYSVSGRLIGEPLGTMTLVVNGERVVGSVQTRDRSYNIRSVGAGLSVVSEVEEEALKCGIEEVHPETIGHRH